MGERKEKSLSLLTTRFMDILKTKRTVDLNEVAKVLNCSKKRRIYDVSNVLEGIGLITRTSKNLYTYLGRQRSESVQQVKNLQQLISVKSTLEASEKELDRALKGVHSNLESLAANKSYQYVTRDDLVSAFSEDTTTLVAKDYKQIKFIWENVAAGAGKIPQVYFKGHLVRPVQMKMVSKRKTNSANAIASLDTESMAMLNEVTPEEENPNSRLPIAERSLFNHRDILKRSKQLRLFKRSLRQRQLIDHDRSELESLAKNVLMHNKYEGKSKFQYVSDMNLVQNEDYENPDFITFNPHPDNEYAENYSASTPSVYDLYDIDDYNGLRISSDQVGEDEEEEYEIEMIHEEADSEEKGEEEEDEYIIEELDEEMYEMMQ